jgi:PhoH-like ATPase
MQYNKAPVVLVTKDINMQLKARAVGIECQDYLNDKVVARSPTTMSVVLKWIRPNSSASPAAAMIAAEHERLAGVCINEYVLLAAAKNKRCRRGWRRTGVLCG